MPSWVEKLVIELLKKYFTAEVIKEFEAAAAAYVVGALRELAKSTDETKIDDAIVEVVAQALGVP